MNIRLANKVIQQNSIVDGEGLRAVIWAQGCSHNCKGCHNPETHDFNGGFLVPLEDVKKQIAGIRCHDGVTFSGGDPMFQIDAFCELAKYIKSLGLNIWCYTGFKFETLLKMASKNPTLMELLENIDVLVDGKFDLSQKSLNLYYKGSRNQRIIDVKSSLLGNAIVEIEKYKDEKKYTLYSSEFNYENGLFI